MIRKTFLLVILIALLSYPVNAIEVYNETYFFSGNNILSNIASSSGVNPVGGTGLGSINTLVVNFNSGKEIGSIYSTNGILQCTTGSIRPRLGAGANGLNQNYTAFTSTVNGQFYGSGTIGWERFSGDQMTYKINFLTRDDAYANTLTGNQQIVLTYDHSVYTSNVNANPESSCTTPNLGTSIVFTLAYFTVYGHGGVGDDIAVYGTSPIFVNFVFSDSATLTANTISSNFAYINLSKNGVNYELNVTNSTDSSLYDVTSVNDVSQIFNITNGLKTNTTHVLAQSSVLRTIFLNGGAVAPQPTVPTPTPTAQPPFSSSNFINTTKGIYNNTESEDIFGSFYPATSTQEDCLFFGFFCTETTINTESTTGYVFIRTQGSTSPIKFPSFTVDQSNNFNVFTTLDIGTYQAQLYGFAAPGSTCTSGVVYDFPENIPLGCYYPHNITTFQVVNNTPGLFIHWQTKLPNTTAIYGDTITVAWNNVTANDIVKIYDNTGTAVQTYFINLSTVNQIPVFIPLYTIGVWNATIYNGSDLTNNASAFLNVVPPGAISVNNSFGISMYWVKASDIIDKPTLLNWSTGSYSGAYTIVVLFNGAEVRNNSYAAVPGQSQQAVYTFDTEGTYVAEFLDVNGTIQAQSDIQITQPIIQATSTEPIPSGSEATQSMGDNLTRFMAMPAFWGVILFIIGAFAVSSNDKKSNRSDTGMFIFILANLLAVIGLWSPFTWYVLAITWIIAAVYFYFGRELVGH